MRFNFLEMFFLILWLPVYQIAVQHAENIFNISWEAATYLMHVLYVPTKMNHLAGSRRWSPIIRERFCDILHLFTYILSYSDCKCEVFSSYQPLHTCTYDMYNSLVMQLILQVLLRAFLTCLHMQVRDTENWTWMQFLYAYMYICM